jgi:hypothetical protein
MRFMRRVTISLFAVLVTAGCASRVAPPVHVRTGLVTTSQWQLVRQYSPAQLADWRPAPWPTNNRSQLTCYTHRDVSHGRDLLLNITSQPCDGRPESGAWLQSRVMWRYGMYEARIYLPASASAEIANWPAFWLENPNQWPVNGEIDVMEGLGGWDCQAVHYGPAVHKMRTTATSPHCLSVRPGWHTFAVIWEPRSVTWYIDGNPTGVVSSHVPTHQMQIVLDYTASRTQVNNRAPATMRVAWVRIFRRG